MANLIYDTLLNGSASPSISLGIGITNGGIPLSGAHSITSASLCIGSTGAITTARDYTFGGSNTSHTSVEVQGDAKFSGEITIKGVKLSETLAKIEERLAILHPNVELEDRWDELKELSKRYKELEAEIIEKEKVWAILKR
jgi:hypothetical protein